MTHNQAMRQALKFSCLRGPAPTLRRGYSSEQSPPKYEFIKVDTPSPYVYHVILNRPEKRNAMNVVLWREIGECFNWLRTEQNCRAVVLSGAGKMFTSGIDVADLMQKGQEIQEYSDVARKFKAFHEVVGRYQDSFTQLEKCPKPIIAAIHGRCVGGGVDLISATDVRFCSQDAMFCVKEVDMGLAADVGTLQRLPKLIGNQSLVRELAFTARNVYSDEALRCGLVSRVLPDHDTLITAAIDVAKTIASKSPVAVQGTKVNLLYSRDHPVQDSLAFQRFWSGVMLQSEDIVVAATSQIAKDSEPPVFSKL